MFLRFCEHNERYKFRPNSCIVGHKNLNIILLDFILTNCSAQGIKCPRKLGK